MVGELVVEEEHQNAGGTLHGGLTATLVDSITTLALLSMENGRPGVSIDLHVSWVEHAFFNNKYGLKLTKQGKKF